MESSSIIKIENESYLHIKKLKENLKKRKFLSITLSDCRRASVGIIFRLNNKNIQNKQFPSNLNEFMNCNIFILII